MLAGSLMIDCANMGASDDAGQGVPSTIRQGTGCTTIRGKRGFISRHENRSGTVH